MYIDIKRIFSNLVNLSLTQLLLTIVRQYVSFTVENTDIEGSYDCELIGR